VTLPQLLVQPVLGLLPERVVDPSENEEEAVSGICGLRDDGREVRGLAALDVSQNEAAAVVGAGPVWVRELGDDLRRRLIQVSERVIVPALLA
jgi:hypothetical protein